LNRREACVYETKWFKPTEVRKTYTYEVQWQFKPNEDNAWVSKENLVKMGYLKLVQQEDERQAAMQGLQDEQLTQLSIEKHLADFAIDAEAASHTNIGALSGGQKVKVVIAAAMWQNPHILILDEPTNYLDREGLGALTMALKDFGGGVIIISHNREFADKVATEKWIMDKGYLRREGDVVGEDVQLAGAGGAKDDVFDGAGNKIEVNINVSLSDKDKKKKIKELEKKLKDHNKKASLEEEQMYEMMDLLEKLKSEIVK